MTDQPKKKRRPRLRGFSIEVYPCNGEAHKPEVAGQVDHCGVCMGSGWGVVGVIVHPDGHRQKLPVSVEGFVRDPASP
jgi:hypothetical protein